jgi:hypothetical protein
VTAGRAKAALGLSVSIAVLAGTAYLASGLARLRPAAPDAQPGEALVGAQEKKLSHQETLRWVVDHRAWRTARKTKPIWARAVREDEVGKEFQTADQAVEKARAGYWLCAGIAGEPWFQTPEKVEGKYDFHAEEVKRFGFDDEPRTYKIFKPKATTRNWVAQVRGPGIAGFFIRPHYDPAHPLYSPAGGYVVRDPVEDPYQADPGDVWLVQEGLFDSTYELIP